MNGLEYRDTPVNLIIIGASGDLTKRKLIPALFALYCNGLLPREFRIFGFARTNMTDEQWRAVIVQNLTCRYTPGKADCDSKMKSFLERCHYHPGNYNSILAFKSLGNKIVSLGGNHANSMFYMAIPPSIFMETAYSLGSAGLIKDAAARGWSRVVLEKPFGRDSQSSEVLLQALSTIFTEEQTFRIDHYLGKEVVQNLLILRFANLIFDPIWNRNYIDHVEITFSEKIGCEGRAGYFDEYGIIRDVVQNHLLQVVALVAMEQPVRLAASDISDEKVKLLRCVVPVKMSELITGQYVGAKVDGVDQPGYQDDPEVPKGSTAVTYARARMHIHNRRWFGVPFYVSAGKALAESMTEITVQFKDVGYSIFNHLPGMGPNRLVIRVQPSEAISLQIVSKVPGLEMVLETPKLDLLYHTAFSANLIPEAYERLLLDVLRGDHSLFLRNDELAATWDVVTPVLHELEENGVKPLPYAFGSHGPTAEFPPL